MKQENKCSMHKVTLNEVSVDEFVQAKDWCKHAMDM